MRAMPETLYRFRPPSLSRGDFLLGILAMGVGVGVGAGGLLTGAAVGLATLAVLVGLLIFWLDGTRKDYMSIEIPVFLILLVTLVLRYATTGGPRDAEALTKNPFDLFSMFRLGCVALAAGLGLVALCSPRSEGISTKLTNRPARFYSLYALVAFLGIGVSVHPALTLYRVIELVGVIVVVAGAYRRAGDEALGRIERMLYWYSVALVGSVWVGVALWPGVAVETIKSPIPLRVHGVFPHVSSDTLGHLGVVLVVWSLARFLAPGIERGPRRSVALAIAGFGFVSLVAAQYRTGYASLACALVVLMVIRSRTVLATLAMVAVLALSTLGGGFFAATQPYVLRGQDVERARRLQGRITYWSAALPIWEQSPIIGGGLQTASRLVALTNLDAEKDSAQNLHSTWMEALVGTGAVGFLLLASYVIVSWGRAMKMALLRGGRFVPALIMTVILVRSFTGGSFEQGGDTGLLFLVMAWGLRDAYFFHSKPVYTPLRPLPVGEGPRSVG